MSAAGSFATIVIGKLLKKESLLIKGGRVIIPEDNIDKELDILIIGGKIAEIKPKIDLNNKEKIIDATGKVVSGGWIDLHTHLREPGDTDEEDLKSGSRAAAYGGFAAILAMPNTNPPLDCPELIRQLQSTAQEYAKVYIAAAMTLGGEGKKISDYEKLKAAGIVAISDDGFPIQRQEIMLEAMRAARAAGLPVLAHCEAKSISAAGVINAGEVSRRLGLKGIARDSEELMVARNILLALRAGCRLHIQHISTKGSVELIRAAKSLTDTITCEVTPHHLILTEAAVYQKGALAKTNPPLRSPSDREALLEALADDTIDVIASDHAPHLPKEKIDLRDAAFGICGLDTTLPLSLTYLYHQGVLPLSKLIEKFTYRPAKVLGIEQTYKLKVGNLANLTIIDLEAEKVIEADSFKSKSRNSPFLGYCVRGLPYLTIIEGKVVKTP